MWPSLCYNNTLYDIKIYKTAGLLSLSLACISCSNSTSTSDVDDIIDIGKPTEKKDMPEDYYTGGELGTVLISLQPLTSNQLRL